MSLPSLLSLLTAVAVLVWIVHLVRRGLLGEHFAAIWVAVGVVTVVLAAFPGLLYSATGMLGFALPVNLLFMSALLVQLLVSVHLSVELGRRQSETRALAEQLAVLRLQVTSLAEVSPEQRIGPTVHGVDDTVASTVQDDSR